MPRDQQSSEDRGEAPRIDEGLRQRIEGIVPEIIRRTFYAGLGAVFTTEEGVRKLATEFSLPKDVANYLVQQAGSTKKELFRIVAAELRSFLESLNLQDEMQRLLTSLSFEIKTEIRFIPNDARLVKPQIRNKMAVKRGKEQLEDLLGELPLDEEPAEPEPPAAEEPAEDDTSAGKATPRSPSKTKSAASKSPKE